MFFTAQGRKCWVESCTEPSVHGSGAREANRTRKGVLVYSFHLWSQYLALPYSVFICHIKRREREWEVCQVLCIWKVTTFSRPGPSQFSLSDTQLRIMYDILLKGPNWELVDVSVQSSCSVMSDSLLAHELQHTRLPYPSPTPRACSNLCPLSQWCHPAISSSVVPFSSCPIFPSIRVFSNELVLHLRWPKYWNFSISPSSEYSGLISFRIDWFVLLAVQRTLKSILQHHSSKMSILWHSAFFMVQLSHPYVITGKTIALTRWTFVGKIMSLLFNILSSLVITFLPRSKCLLISWPQSPSAVILEPPKNKVSHYFHCFPIYLSWSDGTGCHDLRFLNVEL